MKTSHSLLVLALCGAPLLLGGPPADRLERDSPVTLRLKQALSSETSRVNDRVEFEVVEDVRAGAAVVIPRGSSAWGKVADAAPRGRMMRNGRLAVDIESVALPDGSTVKLRASSAAHPPAKPQDTTADTLGALPALPVAMFQYGKIVEIPAGKVVTVYTAAQAAISVKAGPEQAPADLKRQPMSVGLLPALTPPPPSSDRVATPAAPSASTADRGTQSPERETAVSHAGSKKLLTILAVAAAVSLAGVLAAKGHGGSQTIPGTATSAPATPTTVGLGPITVGGPH